MPRKPAKTKPTKTTVAFPALVEAIQQENVQTAAAVRQVVVALGIKEEKSHILGFGIGFEGGRRAHCKPGHPVFVKTFVEGGLPRLAGRASLEEIEIAIAVHIGPGMARSLTGQPVRQQGLQGEVIEGALHVEKGRPPAGLEQGGG